MRKWCGGQMQSSVLEVLNGATRVQLQHCWTVANLFTAIFNRVLI